MRRAAITITLVCCCVASAQVVDSHTLAYWKINEGSGTLVEDFSSNGNHGTVENAVWTIDAKSGGAALEFNGTNAQVVVPDSPSLHPATGDITIGAWIKVFSNPKNWGVGGSIVYKGSAYQWVVNTNGALWLGIWGARLESIGTYDFEQHLNEWHHCATAFDHATQKAQIYVDGELNIEGTAAATIDQSTAPLYFGNKADDGGWFHGIIDEVQISDVVRTQEEIQASMKATGYPFARSPSPADGSIYQSTWANLSWKPGDYAVSHDVYLGESCDDVNDGLPETFRGNQTLTFLVVGFPGFPYPNGLVPGTTYYWRVDEVNDADPNSPWKGNVWSFTVPSMTAYDPNPADGARYQNPDNVTLSWAPGYDAKLHYVYFGDSFDNVSNAAAGLPVTETTYAPGKLEVDKTYYWRVDEFDGVTTRKGDVWSFSTMPPIAVTDPNLLCWWKLDEGEGTTAVDWSGHGAHGTLVGTPKWVAGYDGGAISVNGAGESVIYNFTDKTFSAYTLTVWAKSDVLGQDNNSSICSTYLTTSGGFQISYDAANSYQYHAGVDQVLGPASLNWVHLAISYDGTTATAYYNGEFVATFTPAAGDLRMNKYAVGVNRAEDNWFDGSIDDFRVYNRALSQEEIQYVMRGDPMVAWDASPSNGSNPDIDAALPLSWSPGDDASRHDVYFSTDKSALDNADTSDTTGVYRGRENATTYMPPEGVEWGGGPYYWRIDEFNTDGTITRGRIWSFTVADFILVDDFESYTDNDTDGQAIWQYWIDGFGVPSNGAQVGYLLPPYAEQTIVHGGYQSMPFMYDNTDGVTNSEAALALTAPRDWTRHGLTDLSLWFRGQPASVGSFVEAPAGTFTMAAAGADIWGTADQFHYAYKMLTGPGSIVARVNSLQDTHISAKAGVMIRETLNPGSKHAFACMTAENGVASQGRTTTDGTSFTTNDTDVTAPHWVKLERDASGNFTVSHSANGTAWQPVDSAVPTNIPMASNVYIGLAVTSHNTAVTCQAVFSNVTTTGNVSGQWQHQDVGIASNAAEPMYVQLSNANGTSAIVANDDPAAATINAWTEWRIPLQAFADQGINLADVDSIAIGLGSKGGVAAGGTGTVYIDDIRLYQPTP